MAELFDIGVNLTNRSFADDLDGVLQRASGSGVTGMAVTGTSVEGSRAAADLAAAHPGFLWSTAGVHPHHASSWTSDTIAALRELCRRPEVVAVGECGLDFNRDYSPREVQRRAFVAQLELAAELGLPVFLHERDASEALLEILATHRAHIPRAVVHCFTGDAAALRCYLDLDLHIGITGWICDERRGQHLRELVREIPEDRLMIETDAPYLLPRTIRPRPSSRRNEPAHLVHVATTVAECLGVDVAVVAERTSRVAKRFFAIGT